MPASLSLRRASSESADRIKKMHISLHRDDDVIRKACFCCHVFCFAFAPDEPLPRQNQGDGETHPEQTWLPADLQEEAVKTVLARAELLCAEWV